eukprot:c16575_g1_i1.p1 GENE.c16575_g1_i1~~c16575_g1_i1.p1  ORF type:complete len:261 (-),score=60.45 c16575_g1_i1:16-798(-)
MITEAREISAALAKQRTMMIEASTTSGRGYDEEDLISGVSNAGASLFSADPSSFAAQLTIIESKFYSTINTCEFLQLQWSNLENSDSKYPNIAKWVTFHHKLTSSLLNWITKQKENVQQKCVQLILETTKHLRKQQNCNSLRCLSSLIQSPEVSKIMARVKISATLLKQSREAIQDIENDINYQQFFKTLQPPFIPYFQYHLNLIRKIDESSATIIDGQVNFEKQSNIYQVFDELLNGRISSYSLKPDHSLQNVIFSLTK